MDCGRKIAAGRRTGDDGAPVGKHVRQLRRQYQIGRTRALRQKMDGCKTKQFLEFLLRLQIVELNVGQPRGPCFEFRPRRPAAAENERSEEHTSELQSLMRISYAVFCLKKKNIHNCKQSKITLHQHQTKT